MKPITISVVLFANIVGCGGPTTTGPTPTSLVVNCASTTLNLPGQSTQCTATVALSDATTQDQTTAAQWTSSDQTILKVTGGLVTSQGGGSAVITAAFQGVSGSKTITVLFAPPPGK